MPAIALNDVSISIPVYDVAGSSLRRAILGRAVGGRFAQSGAHVIVNALKSVSFDAHDGDRIGLVGQNGSGKTTLLRVLSGVYPPTAGTVAINGRVSPMFDHSLGMASDATGIENVRICGALWGLTRRQIEASLDDVIEFTELGDYLKMPVRTYSQGMQLRLAFAIATLREPDILLLDEVIGVGDASFYQKALARLMKLVKQSRILFVASHSKDIIRQLCNKAIWLHKGNLISYGQVDEVSEAYEKTDPEKILSERSVAREAATGEH
jgi:ABC-2 type transport system ATP-binding protein/lipopolysaccharide transport system ATP-binding protein